MLRRSYTARWLIPITERQAKRLLNFYPLSEQWILSAVKNLGLFGLDFFARVASICPYSVTFYLHVLIRLWCGTPQVRGSSELPTAPKRYLAVESHFSVPSFWGESRIFHLHCSIYRKCSYQHWNIHDTKILIWALANNRWYIQVIVWYISCVQKDQKLK